LRCPVSERVEEGRSSRASLIQRSLRKWLREGAQTSRTQLRADVPEGKMIGTMDIKFGVKRSRRDPKQPAQAAKK
jgi:hypothetical protein